jgi:acetyltransferase-like isoleucine patch superfamily enzyme
LESSFILKVKRGETPFYRVLGRIARALISPSAPRIPNWSRPVFRALYGFHFLVAGLWHSFCNVCYRQPLFQGRCATYGRGVTVDRLPFVYGHAEIHVGNYVWIGGRVSITSARVVDRPVLILKDYCQVSWNVSIVANKEVIIEEHARVSFDCRISDSDGHPREADLRAKGDPPRLRDIRPVHIGKHAWIGNGTHIMKGVTIGEGAIIGANSVVINNIPPYCLALGNPAEVILRNCGRPVKPFEEPS